MVIREHTSSSLRTRGLHELTLQSGDHRELAGFHGRVLSLLVLSEQEDRIWLGCIPNALGLWPTGARRQFGARASTRCSRRRQCPV